MQQIRTVSIGEVQMFLQNHPEGFLIDVLPSEFHARRHIPGSSGVCVFETAFQEKMRALVPDMDAPLLLYGAGGSWDSAVAAEKLQREGYTDISLFAGDLRLGGKPGFLSKALGWIPPCRMISPCRNSRSICLSPKGALSNGRAITISTAMTGRFPCEEGNSASHTARQGRGTGF